MAERRPSGLNAKTGKTGQPGMQSVSCASCTSRRALYPAGSPGDHWEPSSPGPRPATYRRPADLALSMIGHLPVFLLTYDAAGTARVRVRGATHCRCAVDEGRPKDLQPVAFNWAQSSATPLTYLAAKCPILCLRRHCIRQAARRPLVLIGGNLAEFVSLFWFSRGRLFPHRYESLSF